MRQSAKLRDALAATRHTYHEGMGKLSARYRVAAVLMIIHGGLMEFAVFLAVFPLLALGVNLGSAGQYFSFNVPYFQEHLVEMMVLSGVFGATRIVGAIGVLRNRLWGFALSIINCVVTMVLMVFMLPAGIVDGILASASLLLLLTAYFGARELIPREQLIRSAEVASPRGESVSP